MFVEKLRQIGSDLTIFSSDDESGYSYSDENLESEDDWEDVIPPNPNESFDLVFAEKLKQKQNELLHAPAAGIAVDNISADNITSNVDTFYCYEPTEPVIHTEYNYEIVADEPSTDDIKFAKFSEDIHDFFNQAYGKIICDLNSFEQKKSNLSAQRIELLLQVGEISAQIDEHDVILDNIANKMKNLEIEKLAQIEDRKIQFQEFLEIERTNKIKDEFMEVINTSDRSSDIKLGMAIAVAIHLNKDDIEIDDFIKSEIKKNKIFNVCKIEEQIKESAKEILKNTLFDSYTFNNGKIKECEEKETPINYYDTNLSDSFNVTLL